MILDSDLEVLLNPAGTAGTFEGIFKWFVSDAQNGTNNFVTTTL
jgi:hypothetical protein